MTHSFDWAAEMGIDQDLLAREHFSHIDQIRNHSRIGRQAEAYWARERFLARLEYSSKAISVDTPEPAPVKIRAKKAKVSRYEFTDAQLEIAFRSLNAGGSV